MRQIKFITYSGEPNIAADDRLLALELGRRGFDVHACPWDSAEQDDRSPTTYIVRSPWNYDRAPEDFLRWLASLEESGHKLINSLSLVRWNIHKRYLLEAAARGLAIPRTLLLPRTRVDLEEVISAFSNREYVVLKPAISLSAHETYRVRRDDALQFACRLPLSERDYMIQEFVPDIVSGELSFVFVGGQFSHCVRKIPRAGDFRTQGDFGATREEYRPTIEEVESASQFLALAPEQPIFARVDVVQCASTPLLMELELIDPVLFFEWAPDAVPRFAALIENVAE